ncbi:MAG TPA: PIG-L deacetylase family protein [Candidimonas sp.]|nr:PIG-L deacetylase family protein [Candidimonas sp.]
MSKTILVVAAHTDDEALGCGGTIARHVAEGDKVHAIFLADGVTSRPGVGEDDARRRAAAAGNAQRILGLSSVIYLNLPDNRLDSLALLDIVQPLERAIESISPEVIYTHHHGDLNVDHRIAHQAVMTACRPIPGAKLRAIYTFEVMSSTEWATQPLSPFIPVYYVDITEHLTTKLDALSAYELEMRDAPHSRSIEHLEHLSRHRGHSIGVPAAEAFMVIRVLR